MIADEVALTCLQCVSYKCPNVLTVQLSIFLNLLSIYLTILQNQDPDEGETRLSEIEYAKIHNRIPFTMYASFASCMSLFLFRQISRRLKVLISFVIVVALCLSISAKVVGIENMIDTVSMISKAVLQVLLTFAVFSLADNLMHNLSVKQMIKVAELNKEVEQVKLFLAEQNELLQSLEEGIVVVEDEELTFANEIFKNVIGQQKFEQGAVDKMQIFKVYSEHDDDEKSARG